MRPRFRPLLMALLLVLLLSPLPSHAAPSPAPLSDAAPSDLVFYPTYELRFQSTLVTTAAAGSQRSEVSSRFLLPHPDDPAGCGDGGEGELHYDLYAPPPPCNGSGTDAVLKVVDAPLLRSPAADSLTLIIQPSGGMWSVAHCPPSPIPIMGKHWFAGYVVLHRNEFTSSGQVITGWTFPGGDVYARKVYDRQITMGEGTMHEHTTIEIVERPSPVRIQEIFAHGLDHQQGCTALAGGAVRLQADMVIPPEYEVLKYLWQGDLVAGLGDVNRNGLYKYTPPSGGHGRKTITLVVTYRHKESGAMGCTSKDHNFIVYFSRDGDDDGDGEPNWFEYWGRDGAVPGLDAPDVRYDPDARPVGYFNPNDGNVYLGPKVTEGSGRPLHFPAGLEHCPVAGETQEYNLGAELAAVTLIHERYHGWQVEQEETPSDQGGWEGMLDSDGDRIPDSYERDVQGTSPNDPDSCDLGELRCYDTNGSGTCEANEYSPYRDIGDMELGARMEEANAQWDESKDFSYPGPLARNWCPDTIIVNSSAARAAAPQVGAGQGGPLSTPAASLSALFEGDAASLSGSYADRAVDNDGDGLNEALQIDVGLQVQQSAIFTLVGYLQAEAGGPAVTASSEVTLSVGAHTVPLRFDGAGLRALGNDGPYTLQRVVLRVDTDRDIVLMDEAENVHTTAAYEQTSFAGAPVALAGNYTESAMDSGSDGLYDLLRYDMGLDVRAGGRYTVTGQLGAAGPVAVASTAVDLQPGARTVQLDFSGSEIFRARQDGPYVLGPVRVQDASGRTVAAADDLHSTAAYTYDAFQHGAVYLLADGYSSAAVDEDGDGTYEGLQLELSLMSNRAAGYRVLADLLAPDGGAVAGALGIVGTIPNDPLDPSAEELFFEPEVFTGTLRFDGRDISAAMKDGPYTVTNVTVAELDGELLDVHDVAHTTAGYRADEFESPFVAQVALPMILRP